jgi:hypothetical protein
VHPTVETPLMSTTRRVAAWAGPFAVLSLVLLIAALAVTGDDIGAVARSPLGVAANAIALLSVGLLLVGLVHLVRASSSLHDQAGGVAALLAGAGTLLLAGGAWSQLVMLPALAVEAPAMANEGHPLVTAGYVGSFLLAGAGWLLVALRVRRDGLVTRGHARLLLAGSLLMIAPLPSRWFLLALAVTLVARRRPAEAAAPQLVPAAR